MPRKRVFGVIEVGEVIRLIAQNLRVDFFKSELFYLCKDKIVFFRRNSARECILCKTGGNGLKLTHDRNGKSVAKLRMQEIKHFQAVFDMSR